MAIRERRVIHLPDLEHNPNVPPSVLRANRAGGFRTLLLVPMMRGEVALGAVTVSRTDGAPFSDRQIALLQTFADQAVIAIENVRLFTELEARNKDLAEALERQTATAEILRAISQAQTDAQPVFEAIADSAMRLLGAWSVLVYRCDGERVRLAAARGGHPGSSEAIMERRGAEWSRPVGALSRVVLTRRVQQIVDVETDPSLGPESRELARDRGWRSSMQHADAARRRRRRGHRGDASPAR